MVKAKTFNRINCIFRKRFLYHKQKQLPETSFNANNIFIKATKINFSKDDDVSDNLFILEKSPRNRIKKNDEAFLNNSRFSNLFKLQY